MSYSGNFIDKAIIQNDAGYCKIDEYGTTQCSHGLTTTGSIQVGGGNMLFGIAYEADLGFHPPYGTNITGKDLNIYAQQGTGTGTGGDIKIKTSVGGSTGSTINPLSTKMIIKDDGKIGISDTAPISELSVGGKIAITAEQSTPTAPADGNGWLYTKSDGKIYWQSHDVAETDLTSGGSGASDKIFNSNGSCEITTAGDTYVSNKLGVGTNSPDTNLHVVDTGTTEAKIIIENEELALLQLKQPTSNKTYNIELGRTDGDLTFRSMTGEKLRLTETGYFGRTNNGSALDAAPVSGEHSFKVRTTGLCLYTSRENTGSLGQIGFYNPNGRVGQIRTSGLSTSYATSSDYRLKENVVPMTNAINRVKQLKPSRFNFIAEPDITVDGFLAHEVQDIVPEAISGEKDAMETETYEISKAVEATYDNEGNELTPAIDSVMGEREVPDYQGIDQGKLVPLLVGAIQELTARIEALESS